MTCCCCCVVLGQIRASGTQYHSPPSSGRCSRLTQAPARAALAGGLSRGVPLRSKSNSVGQRDDVAVMLEQSRPKVPRCFAWETRMAFLTIGRTRFDRAVAGFAEDRATPAAERALQVLTYAADGGVLLAAAIGFWRSRAGIPRASVRPRRIWSSVALSAVLPHLLKALVDQERPDRRVHGFRHGIPVSGNAQDAFPSGHAVHVGAVVSAI